MAQRVASRGRPANPSVILMERAFAALDAQTKLEMQEELVPSGSDSAERSSSSRTAVDEALILATHWP